MIVVCGEALFDVFATGEAAGAVELSARQGGSPFNLATGVARLGGAALFFGGLAHDTFGRKLYAALAAEGVDLSAAPRPEAPTALVMVSVDDQGAPLYTFQAGLLAWLARAGYLTRRAVEGLAREELVEALRFAARAAAIICSRRGADLPYTSELAGAETVDLPQP
jgi:sugar/nucleoside kinase (ribokinase family)